ncbi:DUF6602 domain-containing protein [Pseudomonas coleopterorum]|uniref:DUF6602 domain-containing protein n=1 Tax=Pseudomonas coleopterorum TaxID=1605838 RepID=A0ABR9C0H3_9PSED|nr:DUF6602 domain-containing protein [Pseudomonas coleopterorum]MBD8753823.1 hypothetical protein [Pseudomonas coleopterorum]MBD8770875.1 hypothetical protein [Pseudomonas coleopterorum]
MEPIFSGAYIYSLDPWDQTTVYRVRNINKDTITLEPFHELFGKDNTRTIPRSEQHALWPYPFVLFKTDKEERLAESMSMVGDLVCALLAKHKNLPLGSVVEEIIARKEKYKFKDEHAPWILRCLVASNKIQVLQKGTKVTLSFSPTQAAREKQRQFSATIASELASLSERVRCIISHGPTVGTYRENLLQNVLKKHLPERYHIATGFIYGLSKQIDILIYDRIDYAPIFREGDLVIVPPEAVRAVIEVKTNLTTKSLHSALELIGLASYFDDNEPPFFKGIFSFESSLKSEAIYKIISDFYTDINSQMEGGPGEVIHHPFHHLTCACVIGKAFAYTQYVRNDRKRLVPVLYSKNSVTELESQCSLFMQSLLAHLKFGGMKPFKIDYLTRMLGEDTLSKRVKDLRDGDDSWGAYFAYDEGDAEQDAVEQMENIILGAQQWLNGEDNFSAF